MRYVLVAALAAVAAALSVPAGAQSCPAGQTTTISGVVNAPNGTEPLPNVLVFIPSTTPQAFPVGVSCPIPGALPSGAPILAGAITGVDGSFTLTVDLSKIPDLANIPIVVQAGKWRRQTTVSAVVCQNNPVDPDQTRMPRNHVEGDIPKIAIATGSVDQVECVLLKAGIDQSEFTNPTDSGRVNLFQGSRIDGSSTGPNNSGGAVIDSSTPDASTLMSNPALLSTYDVLMLPCEGGENVPPRPTAQLTDLLDYANAGGRVYASHYSYDWMYQNGPFEGVAKWNTTLPSLGASGTATIDISFAGGQTLAQWLQLVGATTTPGQIALTTLRQDQDGVVAPTQSWMTLNTSAHPVMQFTFDTPIGSPTQCGRVLFDEYHVESGNSGQSTFPKECLLSTPMTPQEKLLEFTLFDLTGSGGAPTLTPSSADFSTQAVHFTSAAKTFTWTNNAIFPASVTSMTASGDFHIVSNTCGSPVGPNASCSINVAFTPTALGGESGTLSVASSATTLTASLTGTGIPDLTAAGTTSLNFGNQDVGSTSATQTVVWTNTSSGPVAVPPMTLSGDFALTSTNCGSTLGAGASCNIYVDFKPEATGGRTGVLTTSSSDPAYSGLQTALGGNGVDFTIAIAPTSDSVVAGLSVAPVLTLTPSTGYSNNVTLSCPATASGSTCSTGSISLVLSSPVQAIVQIQTTSKYTVIGYGGIGGRFGLLWLVGMASCLLLWLGRRRTGGLLRLGLFALLLAAGTLSLGGCNGQLPSINSPYTPAGTYSYAVTATDGIVTHSATYTLTVTAK